MHDPKFSDAPAVGNNLKADVHTLSEDAAKMAHDHLVEPLRERIIEPVASLANDARNALTEGVKQAQDAITEKFAGTSKALAETMAQTQEIATRQRERVGGWIAANPFAAVGIALIIGAVLTSIGRRRDG